MRRGRDAGELKLAENVVAARHLTLALVYLDELFVRVSREDLRLLTRGSCVVLDKDSHLPTSSFNTNGERGCVEQEAFGLLRRVAAKDGSPDSSTKGDSPAGADRLVRLLAIEEVTDELQDAGNTGRAANEDNFVHV